MVEIIETLKEITVRFIAYLWMVMRKLYILTLLFTFLLATTGWVLHECCCGVSVKEKTHDCCGTKTPCKSKATLYKINDSFSPAKTSKAVFNSFFIYIEQPVVVSLLYPVVSFNIVHVKPPLLHLFAADVLQVFRI